MKDYCEISKIEASSLKVERKVLDIDINLIEKFDLLNSQPTENIDKNLLLLAQKNPKEKDSLMALRGRVSHPISQKINLIYNQFKERYEIELSEMLIILLDDSGDKYLRVPKITSDKKRGFIKKIFCWETIEYMQMKDNLKPFTAEIIAEFNSSLSNLTTWTKNKVQGNSELKSYLKKCGILLISPWALIADSSSKRITEAWDRCGEGVFKTLYIKKLYESYICEYKKAKAVYKVQTGKISGWHPDENFLKSLNPPQESKETLLLLDKALRKYLSAIYTPRQFENNEESQIQSFEEDIDDDSKINLISKIEYTLRNCGEPIIKELISQDKKKWDKDKSRKLAWELYSQGLSQREIASKCEHKQAWVSKLLPEKKISESIAQESAIILLRINEFSSLKNDINGIERLVESLKNHLINSELNEKRPLLKQLIKEAIE